MVFFPTALLALAIIPFSIAQTSNDFENGWDQTTWPIYAPDCNQGGSVSLDNSTAHSGKYSMKVSSPGGYCGHIFFGTTAVPTGDVYVRVWLKATYALTANHVSFITMPDPSEGTNENLRIGGQDQILMFNRESDDATLPDLSPQGVATSEPLPVGSWECFEYHLGTDGSIETWLNSLAIVGLTTKGNLNDGGWTASSIIPKVTGVYFGWESYGGDINTFWYDDVAISSSRVGCAISGSSSSSAPSSSTPTSSTSASSTPTSFTTTTSSVHSSTTSSAHSSTTTAVGTVPLYGQCGGIGWTGGTVCATGTCQVNGPYYSQCLT